MLELKKGIDILAEAGGISTLDEAKALFEARCGQENVAKLNKIANEEALLKIANAISMTEWLALNSFANTFISVNMKNAPIAATMPRTTCSWCGSSEGVGGISLGRIRRRQAFR